MKRNFDPINFMRVIATLFVFFLHTLLFSGKNFSSGQMLQDNPNTFLFYLPAWAGCWIFFVLSGYLAGRGFSEGRYSITKHGVIKYYKRKIMNVYFPTISFIGVCVVFFQPDFFSNMDMIFQVLLCTYNGDHAPHGIGATWLVFTLMWLYFLSPVVCMGLNKIRKFNKMRLVLCLIIVVGLLMRIGMSYLNFDWVKYVYIPTLFNLDLYFGGVCIAYLQKLKEILSDEMSFMDNKIISNMGKKIFGVLFLCVVVINTYISVYGSYILIYQYVFPTIYLLLMCAYLWMFCSKKSMNFYEKRKNIRYYFINWLSSISFEFYLFHSLILERICKSIGGHTALEQHLKMLFVAAVLTMLFSMGYHRIFSRRTR